MAQRISQIPSEAIPYAQEALALASYKRGIGGMALPNAGMANSMDGGAFSKPGANAQEQRNFELANQNRQQNDISLRPQAQAQGAGQVRKEMVDMSTLQSQVQQEFNQFMANVMEERNLGAGIMRLNSIMESPERAKFMNDVAVSSAMYQEGRAPQLGQMIAEANRYTA